MQIASTLFRWAVALFPLYAWVIVATLLWQFAPVPAFSSGLSYQGVKETYVLLSPLLTWLAIGLLDWLGVYEFDAKGGRTNFPISLMVFGAVWFWPNEFLSAGSHAPWVMLPVMIIVTSGVLITSIIKPGAFREALDREINLLRFQRTWAPAKTKDHGSARLGDLARAAAYYQEGDLLWGTSRRHVPEAESIIGRSIRAVIRPFFSAWAFLAVLVRTRSQHAAWKAKAATMSGKEPSILRGTFNGHALVVSGSGGGKTASVVIPNCLTYNQGSLITIDPKGEVHAVTASARRANGHNVYRLKPRDVNSDSMNVIGWLDPHSPRFANDCMTVASWLFSESSDGGDGASFFNETAKRLFAFTLAYKMAAWGEAKKYDAEAKKPTLIDIYNFLFRSPGESASEIEDIYNDLKKSSDDKYGDATPQIKTWAGSFVGGDTEKTWPNTIASLQKNIWWIGDPSTASVITGDPNPKGSGVSFPTSEVTNGKTSIYICIPLEVLESTPGLARLIIGAQLNAIFAAAGATRGNTLFMIDEMQVLGQFSVLHQTGLNQGRGYGITLCGIIQAPSALDAQAGDKTFDAWVDNSQLQMYFAIGGEETAEKISRQMGETTVETTSYSGSKDNKTRGQGVLGSDSSSVNVSKQRHARRLMTATEIMSLGREYAVVFRRSGVDDSQVRNYPMVVGTCFYKARPELMALADENPFERKSVDDPEALGTDTETAGLEEGLSDSQEPSADRSTGEWANYNPVDEVLAEANEGGNSRLSQVAQIIKRIDDTGEVREEDARVLDEALAAPATYAFDHGGLDDLDLDVEDSFELSPGSKSSLDRAEANIEEAKAQTEKQREVALLTATKPEDATVDADDDVARIQELMARIMAPVAASTNTTEAT